MQINMSFLATASLLLWALTGLRSVTACSFETVSFEHNFPAGRLNHCEQLKDNQFRLLVDAENRPINNSPWYAFKVVAKQPKALELIIGVIDGRARYTPKISHDGETWRTAEFEVKDGAIHLSLDASQSPLWVSAQEIIDNQDINNWLALHSQEPTVKRVRLGQSTLGEPIDMLELSAAGRDEWMIIIGRQHPPEVTGSLALFAFVDELLKNSDLTKQFLQRFNLLVIPNLNPDGVNNGHWRHNSKGIDLNRDWGQFTQIETQLVRNKLNQIVNGGGKIVFALDFHSTQQDVFYTMPNDHAVAPKLFVDSWLNQLKRQVISSFVVRNVPGSSPGRGVFKQYIADTYQVHAVTYEMGDNTERALIRDVARQAAQTLKSAMLATPTADFVYQAE